MVEQYRPFVFKMANKFARAGVATQQELVQEGMLSVAIAVRKWRKKGGASVLTWLHRPVYWAMRKLVESNLNRGVTGGRDRKTGRRERFPHASMDAPHASQSGGDGVNQEWTLHDLIGSFDEPRDVLALRQLPKALAKLTAYERRILRMRYADELTFEEIGEKLGGYSRERIRQLEKIALEKLRAAMRPRNERLAS